MADPSQPKTPAYAGPPKEKTYPGFPLLPETRPRRLSVVAPDSNLKNGTFFEALPPELRRQIYLAAFGGRRLHLELEYRRQRKPQQDSDDEDVPSEETRSRNVPRSEDRAWEWWSCVCHSSSVYQYARRPFLNLWLCGCLRERRRGEDSVIDQLGVMGWLQSCRQAYLETIDILYASNSIVLGSIDIANQMDRIFLPQRLQSITCLEFYCSHEFWARTRRFHESVAWRVIHLSMRSVTPSRFPRLRELTIMVDGIMAVPFRWAIDEDASPSALQDAVEHHILQPCDRIIEDYGAALQSFAFCVPEMVYRISKSWLQANKQVSEEQQDVYGRMQLWRPIPESPQTQAAGAERPESMGSPVKMISRSSGSGYWIRCSDPLLERPDGREVTPDFLSESED